MLNLLVFECQEAQFPSDRRRPLYKPLHAADGFVIVAPVSQNNFERLAEAVGHPEWKKDARFATRSEEHTSELQSLMRTSYAVFCFKKTKHDHTSYRPQH